MLGWPCRGCQTALDCGVLRMAADIDQPAVAMRQSRFWLTPLLVGSCFSLGYGITHRLMAMPSAMRDPKPEAFAAQPFPGSSLKELRALHGVQGPLQVDLAAEAASTEAKDPQPKPKPVAAPQAVATATTEPAVIEPAVAEPELVQPEVVQADAVPPQVDLSPLILPLPEPSPPPRADDLLLPIVPPAPPRPTL